MAARMSELVDELLQRNLARDSLRHLDHGREVEVFDGRRKRTRQTGGWLNNLSICRTLPVAPQRE